MKIQVGQAEQYQDIGAEQTYLNVPFQILDDDGTVLQDRNQSFPLNATEDEIKEFLARSLQVYQDNVARYEASKALQEGMDNATQVAQAISGLTM
jgi:hypothetical protein